MNWNARGLLRRLGPKGTEAATRPRGLTLHVALVVVLLQQPAVVGQLLVLVGVRHELRPGGGAAALLGERPAGEGRDAANGDRRGQRSERARGGGGRGGAQEAC